MEKLNRHESMRGYFAHELYRQMEKHDSIYVVTGDLGFGQFDRIRQDYPDRFINVGAAEQTMIGVSVGLALEGKIAVAYSITPFLLYRPFETIRNYVNRERIPVKLMGGGRDKDYLHDGFSHHAEEDKMAMLLFPNIFSFWPETKEEIPEMLDRILHNGEPCYVNLKR